TLGRRLRSEVRNQHDEVIHSALLSYDSRSRLKSRATPEGELSYAYDEAGNLLGTTSSNLGGIDSAFGYDALDRLVSVDDLSSSLPQSLTNYVYDATGNLETIDYGN